jgi:hypothetical protein
MIHALPPRTPEDLLALLSASNTQLLIRGHQTLASNTPSTYSHQTHKILSELSETLQFSNTHDNFHLSNCTDCPSSSHFHTFSLHITNIASEGECDDRFPRLNVQTVRRSHTYYRQTDSIESSLRSFSVFSFTPNKKSQY